MSKAIVYSLAGLNLAFAIFNIWLGSRNEDIFLLLNWIMASINFLTAVVCYASARNL